MLQHDNKISVKILLNQWIYRIIRYVDLQQGISG